MSDRPLTRAELDALGRQIGRVLGEDVKAIIADLKARLAQAEARLVAAEAEIISQRRTFTGAVVAGERRQPTPTSRLRRGGAHGP